jgi:hypothetical protein
MLAEVDNHREHPYGQERADDKGDTGKEVRTIEPFRKKEFKGGFW